MNWWDWGLKWYIHIKIDNIRIYILGTSIQEIKEKAIVSELLLAYYVVFVLYPGRRMILGSTKVWFGMTEGKPLREIYRKHP